MAKTPTIPHTSEDDPVAALVGSDGALTTEGERRANVPTDKLREMYRLMVVCRRLDQEGLNLQRQGELGLWGPIAGHEAAQIGAALAMETTDWIFPYYRDFAMAVARGIEPGEAMAWFRGLTHKAWNPLEHNFGPLIISVGTQIPHAVGYALGCKLDNEQIAVLVGFGEGATSTGDWHEAMNFAGVFKPPIIFLCENNQWAISVPIQEQVAGRVVDRAVGYGFPGVRVDGVDVLSVYAVVKAAAARARAGGGPYLIESLSYRLQAHTTSDDPTRYRTEEEVAPWRARDPIVRCAERLRARDAFDDAFASQCQQEAEDSASKMRQTLLAATPEHPSRVFDSVYKNMPEALRRERDEFLASLEPGDAQ
ncbi:MAG TPA: thiamine pyrophosphate-dependent enzyme [Ktedonobacterales bacterium]|jgi:2-oxoisovalerate dehydrogenase E1 component alpha subunit|nr:thiamine pyrophosphate-dependent enzyme [Ktedonobacterales bacterium]